MNSVFFRNDDLGWVFPKFDRLLALFRKHQTKLCAAAIPMSCLEQLPDGAYREFGDTLEVHSHGLTHLDFEGSGKRAEFGPARRVESAAQDFLRAFEITHQVFGELAAPVFTPPWNRIDERLLPALRQSGFRALSVDGSPRFGSKVIRELNVQIDLHTSKSDPPSIAEIIRKIESATAPVGIMLHHKYMAEDSFAELERLLQSLKDRGIKSLFMRELM